MLFHGPGARETAISEASRLGRLLAPPLGDHGLTVEESRQFTRLLSFAPMGNSVGVVIAGPLDSSNTASESARDALLKSIEEFPPRVQPILWAHDLGDVQETIASRCLERWCPGLDEDVDDVLLNAASELVRASLKGEIWLIPGVLAEALATRASEKEKKRDRSRALLNAAIDTLAETSGPGVFRLWGRLREVARFRDPNPNELALAFMDV